MTKKTKDYMDTTIYNDKNEIFACWAFLHDVLVAKVTGPFWKAVNKFFTLTYPNEVKEIMKIRTLVAHSLSAFAL